MNHKLLLQNFSQLSEYQKESLSRVILNYLEQNESEDDLFPEICPTCGEEQAHFIKAGKQNEKQRIKCLTCNKTFVYTKGRLTYWSHRSKDVWNKVIIDTLDAVPLTDTAAEINMTTTNVFYMRHKILIFFEQLMIQENQLLTGLVEYDETYVNDAYKGRFQNEIPTGIKPRKHGGSASKRGISKEKICILTASNRNGSEVICAVGRAKPTTKMMLSAFEGKIQKNSVCINDGVYSYDCLISKNELENRVVPDIASYTPVYHLNTVNSLHSEWKELWHFYKGVSTKYLNRYLSLFNFMRSYMGMDCQEQFQDINKRFKKVLMIIPVRIVKMHNLLTI